MPIIYIPAPLRQLAGGRQHIKVDGVTVAEAVAAVDRQCPGIADRLLPKGQIPTSLQLVVDDQIVRQLSTPVGPDAEIHFLPAIGGG